MGAFDPQRDFERFSALAKAVNKERLAVLNDEQQAAFEAIQGEKFELPED